MRQTRNQGWSLFVALQAGLGKYCVHLLADYITVAAAPLLLADTKSDASVDNRSNGLQAMEPLAGLPGAALRQGALALYGACSPAEVNAAAAAAAAALVISAYSARRHSIQTCQVAYQFILKIKHENHQLFWQLCAQPGLAPALLSRQMAARAFNSWWWCDTFGREGTVRDCTDPYMCSTANMCLELEGIVHVCCTELCSLLHGAGRVYCIELCVLVAGAAHTCSPCGCFRRNAASCTS